MFAWVGFMALLAALSGGISGAGAQADGTPIPAQPTEIDIPYPETAGDEELPSAVPSESVAPASRSTTAGTRQPLVQAAATQWVVWWEVSSYTCATDTGPGLVNGVLSLENFSWSDAVDVWVERPNAAGRIGSNFHWFLASGSTYTGYITFQVTFPKTYGGKPVDALRVRYHTVSGQSGEQTFTLKCGPGPTQTPQPVPTALPTSTPLPTPTMRPSPTSTPSPVPTPTPTSTPAPTLTPKPSPTPTMTLVPTSGPSPTAEPVRTLVPTAIPSATMTSTVNPVPSPSPTPVRTATIVPTPTIRPTTTVVPSPPPSPTAIRTATPAKPPTATISPTSTPSTRTGKVTGTGGAGVNCRAAASSSAAVIGVINEGSTVVLTGSAANGWQPVTCFGRAGFVSSQYLTIVAPSPTVAATATPSPTAIRTSTPVKTSTPAVTATTVKTAIPTRTATSTPTPSASGNGKITGTGGDGVNCRATASSSGTILTVLPEGMVVKLNGTATNGWQPVICAGKAGFVSVAYITRIQASSVDARQWLAIGNDVSRRQASFQ